MHPVGFGKSDVGRVREQNEDSMLVDDELGLYVVADGMGGHAAGEVASRVAIETIVTRLGRVRAELADLRRSGADASAVVAHVRDAIEHACGRIYEMATANLGQAGMGCAITLLLVLGNKAVMGHVGDTRLYLLRDGRVSQLSSDHTMANELAQAGLIDPDEIKTHQYAHVLTRAVGTQPSVPVDTLLLDVLPADRFVICSDGLHDSIEEEGWLAGRLEGAAIAAVPAELVGFANAAGGHDNVTAIAVQIDPDDPEIEVVDEMTADVQARFAALASVFLFEGLNVALLTRVLDHCEVDTHDAGSVVIRQGDPCAKLMIVTEGRLAMSRDGTRDGELGPGDHAGATTLLAPHRARATLTASEPSRLLTLERAPFWRLVKLRPWLGVGLLERLARQLSLDLEGAVEQPDGDSHTTPVAPREGV
jgi:serine/threonine protein phosphatase PrpC